MEFWQLLCEGRDAITRVPSERFDIDALYDPTPGTPGKIMTPYGGFLDQIDRFDASFFGIAPREASRMDPQQRLLLEVAWEALEDAGQLPKRLSGSRIGVFIGMLYNDYEDLQFAHPGTLEHYVNTGAIRSGAAGRLSFALGLQGPSLAVDTACSSSLVAVHLACQSIWRGESGMALAGGSHLILQPQQSIAWSQSKSLAADGRCKFGDARGDGFIRSEGLGVVVLKRLSHALADQDQIYAVIRGSAVNNDGHSSGSLGTPSLHGQMAALRQAYRSAGLHPSEVQYVEAHGTGTRAGDPVEIQALAAVLGAERPAVRPLLLGSVKTNIGHTEGAAGIAGLIKTALALKHRQIPASLHFHEPNPAIPWGSLPVAIQGALTPWPEDGRPARAGVNSFGISATNAHVVLEEPPAVRAGSAAAPPEGLAHLLPLSAQSPESLRALAEAHRAHLAAPAAAPLHDLCFTSSARRTHHEHRLAVVGRSHEEIAEQLEAFLRDEARAGMSAGAAQASQPPAAPSKLVFVFGGQGAQWAGMGRQLIEQEPVFRTAIERCDRLILQHAGWSLLRELEADAATSRLDQIEVMWPALFAVEVALAELWRARGVTPDAVVGHSIGEVAAAHVAGALSLDDAARVICAQSRLVQRATGRGAMAVVALSEAQAQAAIADHADRLSLAISSSPGSSVLSGDQGALDAVLAQCERAGVFARRVKTDAAVHSAFMDPVRDELLRALADIRPRAAAVPLYSAVAGALQDGLACTPAYWWHMLRERVQFAAAVQQLLDDGFTAFLEISPHPIVSVPIEECLRHEGRLGLVLPSMHRDQPARERIAETLGALQGRGDDTDQREAAGAQRQDKVVLVFPGQGSQWFGMARALLRDEPVFRESLERSEAAMRQFVDWSLLEQLGAPESAARLGEIDVIQPTLSAIQIALAETWRAWGVPIDAVVGHSMGEVAAAYVAGALSLDDAMRIICRRSKLLRRTSGKGAMAVVELTLDQAQEALAGYEDRLSIAVSNSPTSTVLSGDPAALSEVMGALQARDVFCRLVKVDVASHSPQMDPLRDDLLQALADLRPLTPAVPIYSTVLGRWDDAQVYDASYWVRNLREPVLFSTSVRRLLEDGHTIFIEVSPHPILLPAIEQGIRHCGREGLALASMRREEDDRATMLGTLGALYVRGLPVDWKQLYPLGGRCVRLPSYAWQGERFWLETSAAAGRQAARPLDANAHPLLGQHVRSPIYSGVHLWERQISTAALPYLDDHRVQGMVVFPAAGYLEMALAAAAEAFGPGPHALEHVVLDQALILVPERLPTVQTVVTPGMPGAATFQIFSSDGGQDQSAWKLHARGSIRIGQAAAAEAPPLEQAPDEQRARFGPEHQGAEHYTAMRKRGLEYGPAFQGVAQLWQQGQDALARLALADKLASDAQRYQIHPALLDACFQTMVAALPQAGDEARDTYLPVGIGRLQLAGDPRAGQWGYVRVRAGDAAGEATLAGDVFLLDAAGQVLAAAYDLRLRRLDRGAGQDVGEWLYSVQWQPSAARPAPRRQAGAPERSWLIFADTRGVAQSLRAHLAARGAPCAVVVPGETYARPEPGLYQINPARREDFQQLLRDVRDGERQAVGQIVHLWNLDLSPSLGTTLAALEAAQDRGSVSVAYLIGALAQAELAAPPRLWLVTQGAHAVGDERAVGSVAQAAVWGLGRVVAHEHPELRCIRIDLGADGPEEALGALLEELDAETGEDEIALRGGARYAARLVRYAAPQQPAEGERDTGPAHTEPAGDRPFGLRIPKPGIIDHLALQEISRRPAGPGQVEIRVHTSGITFPDVLSALGMFPGYPGGVGPLGYECAGTVVAVGERVTEFAVGDEVVALAYHAHGTHVVTEASLVAPKPDGLSFEEAATIPVAFMTAYYALCRLGHLSKGERILIHSAAGGTGLAAVQIAQWIGAEVFATAGSPEKRAFLASLGIEHVMDSRSLDFADEVLRRTGGRGVDVVLNSLSGDFIPKSLATLGGQGRFLEIGKRDIYQNSQLGLLPFQNNLSFFAIDAERLMRERPEFLGAVFREVIELFGRGVLRPLPLQSFPIAQAADAFRFMAQAKHTGKLVLSAQDPGAPIQAAARQTAWVKADATYLITGGLGGLGLAVAGWLVAQGARHLVLTGRRGLSEQARPAVAALEQAGAEVVVASADIAQPEALADVLAQIERSMPPLRGVIHAAGLLQDGMVAQLDRERFAAVMAPKVSGAWNLHDQTAGAALDFFVLFSSATALLGTPGQGNYAAANAFMDALAHHRRGQGLPAISINWGPWAEVGLAAAQANRGDRLAGRGLESFAPEQGLAALERLLRQGPVQAGVMPLNVRQWCEFYPAAAGSSLLGALAAEARRSDEQPAAAQAEAGAAGTPGSLRETLLAAEVGRQRQELLETFLRQQLAQVLKISPSRIDPNKPLSKLGLDSLMSLEFRNRLEASLGLTLTTTFVWNYPTIALLTPYIATRLDVPLEAAHEPPSPSQPAPTPSPQPASAEASLNLEQIADLSEDEAEALLAEQLASIEKKAAK